MINATTRTVLLLACIAIVGCTTVAPGADGVQIVNEPAAVAGCKPLGEVKATSQSSSSGNDLDELRKAAFEKGADVVLVTRRGIGPTSGVAYRCAP